jgi:lipid-A-disaccharide synthase-like uncharacterized protein
MVSTWLFRPSTFLNAFFNSMDLQREAQKSIIPHAFWYFSLAGGLTLLAYAILRQDPVFIMGQGMGLFVYVRNLMLIRNEHATKI